jgi:hypothetical protein
MLTTARAVKTNVHAEGGLKGIQPQSALNRKASCTRQWIARISQQQHGQ